MLASTFTGYQQDLSLLFNERLATSIDPSVASVNWSKLWTMDYSDIILLIEITKFHMSLVRYFLPIPVKAI